MVNTAAGIGIVLSIIIIAVVVVVAASFAGTVTSNIQENNMCENWYAAIQQKQASYDNMNFLEKLSVDTDSMNADVNAYNQQCAYQ